MPTASAASGYDHLSCGASALTISLKLSVSGLCLFRVLMEDIFYYISDTALFSGTNYGNFGSRYLYYISETPNPNQEIDFESKFKKGGGGFQGAQRVETSVICIYIYNI